VSRRQELDAVPEIGREHGASGDGLERTLDQEQRERRPGQDPSSGARQCSAEGRERSRRGLPRPQHEQLGHERAVEPREPAVLADTGTAPEDGEREQRRAREQRDDEQPAGADLDQRGPH
jgi:hypothetical protein